MTDAAPSLPAQTAHERQASAFGVATRRGPAARLDPPDEVLLQQCILAAIAELTGRSGRPPTYREVLAHLGIRSHRRLSAGVGALVRTGRLARLSGSRNLIVVPQVPPIATE